MPENAAAGWRVSIENVFRRKICQILPMHRGIRFASTELVHRPRSDSPLHSDVGNIWQIRTQKQNASTLLSLSHIVMLAAGLPRQDHVYITTDQLLRFHNNKFDGMPCKLDTTENPRSFVKNPTPP